MLVEYCWMFGGDKMKETEFSYNNNEMDNTLHICEIVLKCICT